MCDAVFFGKTREHHLVVVVHMALRCRRARLLARGAERREDDVAFDEVLPAFRLLKIHHVGTELVGRVFRPYFTARKGAHLIVTFVPEQEIQKIPAYGAGRADNDCFHLSILLIKSRHRGVPAFSYVQCLS